jgi:hypothetical protein
MICVGASDQNDNLWTSSNLWKHDGQTGGPRSKYLQGFVSGGSACREFAVNDPEQRGPVAVAD